MQPELYARLQEACRRLDQPVTVWVREAIKRELQRQNEVGGDA
jgi:predicted DNA-binding protein